MTKPVLPAVTFTVKNRTSINILLWFSPSFTVCIKFRLSTLLFEPELDYCWTCWKISLCRIRERIKSKLTLITLDVESDGLGSMELWSYHNSSLSACVFLLMCWNIFFFFLKGVKSGLWRFVMCIKMSAGFPRNKRLALRTIAQSVHEFHLIVMHTTIPSSHPTRHHEWVQDRSGKPATISENFRPWVLKKTNVLLYVYLKNGENRWILTYSEG